MKVEASWDLLQEVLKAEIWYDIAWFISRKVPLNLTLFSQLNSQEKVLSRDEFLKMAKERIDRLDIASAIEDIIHFIKDQEAVRRTWSKEFFLHWIDSIVTG